jgi:DNA-binding CsgD family transcriptional regulator
VAWTNLGNSLSDAGHHEEAIEALELARAAHVRLENHTGVAMALANRAEIKLNLGRIDAAKADIEEALSLFGAHGGPTGMAIWALTVRATAESLRGRHAAAMATLAQAAAQLAGSESGRTMDDWLDAASTVLSFEHPVTAARCLGAVDRIIEEMGVPRTGTFLRPVAAGRIELAIGRRRLDTERRAGREVDGRTLFEQTAALVARHSHRDPGTIEVPFGTLTAREREILAQLALGRTDREIADELGISAKTASVHVANLKGKLGVGTRTEAALFARERLG